MQNNKAQITPNQNTYIKKTNKQPKKIKPHSIIMTRMEGKNKHIVERETKKTNATKDKSNPEEITQIHNKKLKQ